ncbi:hypothetical protein NLJ89_g11558 [Agrocybe chaxingu]|uniref:Uncharacterized protein n=1 Tax=Agrocybe chaxingu TaxID=84603 RepID=A0A9W8JWJ6_9AGAR|nr:hypothetical protein NLJ89_g11558 [Agrocybe chaxingu]
MESNTLHLMSEKEKKGRSTTMLPNKTLTREPSVIEIELASSRTTPSRDPLASPDCSVNDRKTSQCSSQAEIVSMTQLLFLIFKRTVAWVGGGIAIMILGIGIFQAALLPKIFTCPPGATCDDSYDPNTTMVLQLLQTAMSWWLKVGLIVSGFGLLRLSAYQSWFVMIKHGNSIDNLDLTLGAIKGSLLDAFRLVLRRGNVFLSLLLLAQIGIGAAINLFVGLSIVRSPGDRVVPFSYPPISQLPDSSIAGLNSDGQNQAKAKVVGWALTNDTTHGGALRGSLVTPDGRSNASPTRISPK